MVPTLDPILLARGRRIDCSAPAVMGIVNASPESFSGDGGTSIAQQVDQVRAQLDAGALMVDLGGQSANTRTPELEVAEEIDRLVPLIEAVRAAGIDGLLSIDTYKPAVADACLRAGADIVNDFSALHHPCCGDLTYGADPVLAKRVGLERQWLHAVRLGFEHPDTGDYVQYESAYPDDLATALEVVREAH